MTDLNERVKARWSAEGAVPRPGVGDRQIDAFETKHGVRLTRDVADYFRVVDGMEESGCDAGWNEFFPLEQLTPAAEEVGTWVRESPNVSEWADPLGDLSGWFIFGQYLAWSHVYAVQLEVEPDDAGRVNWIARGGWVNLPRRSASFSAST